MENMTFGVILPNRGVNLGICTPKDLLELADLAEACPEMDSVWVGDALFVNRRLDALTLLAAVAGRTERVLLGPAWGAESEAMGINPADRHKRMIDNMHVMRHLWTNDEAPYESQFHKFSGVTLEPKPIQDPCPIWLATNLGRQSRGSADMGGTDFALNRVGRLADGWMTHSVTPEGFKKSWDMVLGAAQTAGRDASKLDHVMYHHINVSDDKDAALADSKKFLDFYYGADYSKERLEAWLTYGSPRDCIEQLRRFRDNGVRRVAVRISTMGNAQEQFRRVAAEVLPYVNGDG